MVGAKRTRNEILMGGAEITICSQIFCFLKAPPLPMTITYCNHVTHIGFLYKA